MIKIIPYTHQILSTRKPGLVIVFTSIFTLLSLFIIFAARPVFAQEIMGKIVEILKDKAGFVYSRGDEFLYEKETANYTAYAGDAATSGGHKIKLVFGDVSIGFSFLTASGGIWEASSSGAVLGAFTSDEQHTLALATDILSRAATGSAVASGSAHMIDESVITDADRNILTAAQLILDREATVSASAEFLADLPYPTYPDATASSAVLATVTPAPPATQPIRPEDRDLLLYVRLTSLAIHTLNQSIDAKLYVLSKEVSQITSKGKLVDGDNERTVAFEHIATDTDVHYRLNPGGIVQEIFLQNRDHIRSEFVFSLGAQGLSYRDVGKGVWYFSDVYGDVFRIPKAYAVDSSGAFTNDADVRLMHNDGVDYWIITVPDAWIADPMRQFPVAIRAGIEVIPELRDGHPLAAALRQKRNMHITGSALVMEDLPLVMDGDVAGTASAAASPSATASGSADPMVLPVSPTPGVSQSEANPPSGVRETLPATGSGLIITPTETSQEATQSSIFIMGNPKAFIFPDFLGHLRG